MRRFGKIAIVALGALLIFGAISGVARRSLGHNFDRGVDHHRETAAQVEADGTASDSSESAESETVVTERTRSRSGRHAHGRGFNPLRMVGALGLIGLGGYMLGQRRQSNNSDDNDPPIEKSPKDDILTDI